MNTGQLKTYRERHTEAIIATLQKIRQEVDSTYFYSRQVPVFVECPHYPMANDLPSCPVPMFLGMSLLFCSGCTQRIYDWLSTERMVLCVFTPTLPS